MEFFEFAAVVTNEEGIRSKVTIDTLPVFCEEIEAVDAAEALGRVIYFRHWGRFHVCSAEVMGGVRFWVPDCPNALVWTVTTGYPPEPAKITLHATINRTEHSPDFLAATKALLTTFREGLERNFASDSVQATPQPFRLPCL